MSFKAVYEVLLELFPEVDSRLLKGVSIKHSKDANAAAEVVVSEILPSVLRIRPDAYPVHEECYAADLLDEDDEDEEETSGLSHRICVPKKSAGFSSEPTSEANEDWSDTEAGIAFLTDWDDDVSDMENHVVEQTPDAVEGDLGSEFWGRSMNDSHHVMSKQDNKIVFLDEIVEAAKNNKVTTPPIHHDTEILFPTDKYDEAMELAMAISASIESAKEERPPLTTHQASEPTNLNGWGDSAPGNRYNGCGPSVGLTHSEASSSGWMDGAAKEEHNGWGVPTSGAVQNSSSVQVPDTTSFIDQTTGGGGSTPSVLAAPSAPPIPDEALDEGPTHYPSIDFTPVDLSVEALDEGPIHKPSIAFTPVDLLVETTEHKSTVETTEHKSPGRTDVKDESNSSSCIICWEAPVEGACIPCGHMAGCMGCLSEIEVKKGVCPVCRSKINQVIRLYAV